MADLNFTGRVGGMNSGLGFLILGYDPMDEIVVVWIRNIHLDDNSVEMNFGYDEGGKKIVLYKNTPTVLTRAQAEQAQKDGAVLLSLGQI